MTAPTHLAGATAGMLLIAVAFRCLDIGWATILFTMFAGLLPDIDNKKSIIGWLFQRGILILSFGKIDVSRYVKHRGFFHSLPFLFFMILFFFFVRADLISYLVIGVLTHLLFDSFNMRGCNFLGWGNGRGRFSLNWHIPLRTSGEYSLLASCLLVIVFCYVIISSGGATYLIQKSLGTLRASIESIDDFMGYECFLVIRGQDEEKEYFIIDSLGKETIVLLDGNTPISFGLRKECNLKAVNKSYVKKGRKMKTLKYKFILKDKSFRHLYNKIDSSYFYYFSGSALLKNSNDIPFFYNRYNTVTVSGKRLNFEFARLDDLKVYGIEDAEMMLGDFVITYRIAEGQNPPQLSAKITEAVSVDVESIEKRISELKEIINSSDLRQEVKDIFGVDSEEAEVYMQVLRKKAEELLEEEETNLLRIRNMRN